MATTEQTPFGFFSYSRKDSEFVLRLAKDLRHAGAVVWLDQLDIKPGERWDGAVEKALATCDRMLVILSPDSVNSTNVMDEVSFALGENKVVIPVWYRDCGIPFRLRRLQHIDARTDYERGLKELLGTMGVKPAGESTATDGVPAAAAAHAAEGGSAPAGSQIAADREREEARAAEAREKSERERVAQKREGATAESGSPRAPRRKLIMGGFIIASAVVLGVVIWSKPWNKPTPKAEPELMTRSPVPPITGQPRLLNLLAGFRNADLTVKADGKIDIPSDGALSPLFDGSTRDDSVIRSQAVNPLTLTFEFRNTIELSSFRFATGYDTEWKLEAALSLSDLGGQTGSYKVLEEKIGARRLRPNKNGVPAWDSTEEVNRPVRVLRLTLKRVQGSGHFDDDVHVNEVEMYGSANWGNL